MWSDFNNSFTSAFSDKLQKSRNKRCHLTTDPLPHYLVKLPKCQSGHKNTLKNLLFAGHGVDICSLCSIHTNKSRQLCKLCYNYDCSGTSSCNKSLRIFRGRENCTETARISPTVITANERTTITRFINRCRNITGISLTMPRCSHV